MKDTIVRLLDETGQRILRALQENARLPFSELGRQVGLSAPATAERVRRLEEAGVIAGYHARTDAAAIGRPVSAFLRLETAAAHYPAVIALARQAPEVTACHHVSGEDAFVIQVSVPDVGALEAAIARFSPYGPTRTAVVLSTPVDKPVLPPAL
jgi:Lrp/AsnC family leucine-responsive transcriptional regulator